MLGPFAASELLLDALYYRSGPPALTSYSQLAQSVLHRPSQDRQLLSPEPTIAPSRYWKQSVVHRPRTLPYHKAKLLGGKCLTSRCETFLPEGRAARLCELVIRGMLCMDVGHPPRYARSAYIW